MLWVRFRVCACILTFTRKSNRNERCTSHRLYLMRRLGSRYEFRYVLLPEVCDVRVAEGRGLLDARGTMRHFSRSEVRTD